MEYKLEEFQKYAKKDALRTPLQFLQELDTDIDKDDKKLQDLADFSMFMENMEKLKNWCFEQNADKCTPPSDARKDFFEYFESTIFSAFWRYRKHKTSAWSFKKNFPWMLSSALLPALTAVGMHYLESITEITIGSVNLITCGVISFWFVFKVYTDWSKNKNAKETWVRHSICFGRLNLALSRFILSAKKDEDFQRFIKDTDAILEQNLDQFAMNMSCLGLAARASTK